MGLILLLLLPLVGAVTAWAAGGLGPRWPRWLAAAFLALDIVWLLWVGLHADGPGAWLLHLRLPWIPRFGIGFELGMDGLAMVLVALTLLLGLAAVLAAGREAEQEPGLLMANLLLTLTGAVGVFLALDLFLFFVFWELMLIPMYLIIAIWGHEDRIRSGLKFIIFTQASGLLMLTAILGLVLAQREALGGPSFSYTDLLGVPAPEGWAIWLMLGFFLAFAVKLPTVPLHTWLPDAHTDAPTAGSVILAGILLKTGAYGLLRFALPLFPEASQAFAPVAWILGLAGVVYGAVLAFAQSDAKRLVAYTSIAHMGFVLIGVYTWDILGLQGAAVLMVAHGVGTGALFIMVGTMEERMGTRDLSQLGGLWSVAPRMAAVTLIFTLAALGLPGLANFVGEILILLAAFAASPLVAAVAALGLVLAAVYGLRLIRHALHGPGPGLDGIADLTGIRLAVLAAMLVLMGWLGLGPQPLLETTAPTAARIAASAPLPP